MTVTINWLHLTDLHVGISGESWLWPRLKHDLYRDLDGLRPASGGWDLVFFTGDLTQTGTAAEFQAFDAELLKLWEILSKHGKSPQLCVIPGNHDLVRPDGMSAIARALSQLWWMDAELRDNFWRNRTDEYLKSIQSSFANYTAWRNSCSVPLLHLSDGVLPGDFSATYEREGVSLGILGLNSAFLQVGPGNFEGKLDMHVTQLNELCAGDPTEWIHSRTATLLLTHHPVTWLAPAAVEHFRQEIYPPGRFLAHLCGHQHDPSSFELSEAGAPPRRVRQGPSLFGLETWDEPGGAKVRRVHGYNSGAFVFEPTGGVEKIWPRVAMRGRHGGLNLCPDHTYELTKDECFISEFNLSNKPATSELPAGTGLSVAPSATEVRTASSDSLLDAPPDADRTRNLLKACPRLSAVASRHHRSVRQNEQSEFELELRKHGLVWLSADWGMATENFLAASIERFQTVESVPEVFRLRCEDAINAEALESLFPQQFGMAIFEFCSLVSAVPNAFLVLDEIQPEMRSTNEISALGRIILAIRDYCPDLKLVVVSRVPPEQGQFSMVEVGPLDIPDLRSYVVNHPDGSAQLGEPEVLERLHERSDGLPIHVDRMLRALRVSSLAAVLDAELESNVALGKIPEGVSKALTRTVSNLANATERTSRRSFLLLKVLSVLSHGETLSTLKHYLSSEPFFEQNALELRDLALLNVISLQQASPYGVAGTHAAHDDAAPKLLKVPRQVRDCVRTFVSDAEWLDIAVAGIEHFFGRNWRQGKVKLRRLPGGEREYVTSGPGNELALLRRLMAHYKAAEDRSSLRKCAVLASQYCRYLKESDRYRDLATAAEELLQSLDPERFPTEWRQLTVLHAQGLRMIGKRDQALEYLRSTLDVKSDTLSHADRAAIWLAIALCNDGNKDKTATLEAANKVLELTDRHSAVNLQARALILEHSSTTENWAKDLSAFEAECRSHEAIVGANNIAIALADATDDPKEKIRHLNRVLSSKDFGYNHFRAIVAKAEALRASGEPQALSPADRRVLTAAYSYLHSQRFSGLFDRCHRALWDVFEAEADTNRLLRLFRHTSFLWRIRGDESKEAEYLDRIKERVPAPKAGIGAIVLLEIRYAAQRLKAILT